MASLFRRPKIRNSEHGNQSKGDTVRVSGNSQGRYGDLLHVEEPPPVRELYYHATDNGPQYKCNGQSSSYHGPDQARSMRRANLDQANLGQAVEPGCANALEPATNYSRFKLLEVAPARFFGCLQGDHALGRGTPKRKCRKKHPGQYEYISSAVYVA